MSDVQLFLGDCLDILPTLEAGSVDAVMALIVPDKNRYPI
jgi:hypothetical protein